MQEASTCGTCVMGNRRYETLGLENLSKSFKRVKEDSYVLSFAKRDELWQMYLSETSNQEALNSKIEESQARIKTSTPACTALYCQYTSSTVSF